MAAARATGSVFRAGRGLCLIFSLVCLLSLADALNREELEKLKERVQFIEDKAKSLRMEYDSLHSFSREMKAEWERYCNNMQAIFMRGPPEVKPLQHLMEIVKGLTDSAMAQMDQSDENVSAKAENLERKLREMKALLKAMEENHNF